MRSINHVPLDYENGIFMPTIFVTKKGFHLIEILIVLAIIGILSTLAVPLYSQHMVQERRLEAAEQLSKLALAMEEYHVEHNSYQAATLAELHFPEFIIKNNYQLIIASSSDTNYQLIAKPINNQAENDKNCGSLILNSNEEKNVSGHATVEECW